MNQKTITLALLGVLLFTSLQGCGGAENRHARAMERGQAFLAEGNYPKARVEFSNALQIDPNDADARYYSALAAEKTGDLRTAAQGYQAAINVDATHALALAALGRIYVFSGLTEQGLEMVEKGLAAHPEHPELLVVRAAAKLRLGDEQAAFDDASAVLDKHPEHEYAVALLAGIYRTRDEAPKAIELLTTTLDRAPASVDLRTVLAQLYADTGDSAHAEEQLKKIVELRPTELQHRQRLVALYATTGKPEAAEASLRELIALDPKSTEYKFALINFLATQRSFDAAEKELLGFVAANPKDYPLRLATGQFYEAHNLPAEAERVYKEIIVEDGVQPSGLGARNRLATLQIRSNRIEDAEPLIAEVLAENPRDNDALILRASLALASDRALDAVTDLRAVLRDQPNAVPVLRVLARAHIQNNEPDLAREQYRRAVEVDPANDEVRNEYADYLIRSGNADEARRVLDVLLASDPKNLAALQRQYQALVLSNDAAAANQIAHTIVESYPDSPLGYYLQGLGQESAGDFAAARASYENSLEKQSRGAEPLGALVRVLVRTGKKAEARAYLEHLIGTAPDHGVALNLLAEILISDREIERAASLTDQAIKADPSWWLPYRTKAFIHLAQGAKESAIADFVAGMTATGGAAPLGMDLAALFERDQQPDRAIEVYEQLHAKNPSSEPLANNLAMLLSTYRDDDASHSRAQDLVRSFRNSDNPAYLNTYGWVRYRQGQLNEAITYLRRAATAVPDNALMHYHLGMALLANGQSDQARAELEKALESTQRFPGRDAAEKTLESLPPAQG